MKEREIERGEDMEGPDFDAQEAEPEKHEDNMEPGLSNEDTNSNSGAEAKKEEGSPTKKNKEKRIIVSHKYKPFRILKRQLKWKESLELKELELHTR